MNSKQVENIWNQGMDLKKSGEYDKAVEILTIAINGDEENNKDALLQHLYWTRAEAYTELGKFNLALSDLAKAYKLCPDDHLRDVMLISRADVFTRMCEYDLAIADFTEVINNCLFDYEKSNHKDNKFLIALYKDRADVFTKKGCIDLAEVDKLEVLKMKNCSIK